ncbi:hypothetical protein PsorP6_006005 [Peronosclerospora sorghi]|uniref:Uncharacterized protein n=1 Tax=Peronosclerospora sorghi TaxID=230839 RepID=A0ACC0W595_9STRA|nr:hypothetical protein PsorP6_006005 [Peronosclerospora sorghi]
MYGYCVSDGDMSEINASSFFECSVETSVLPYSSQQSGEESADKGDQDQVNGEKHGDGDSLSDQATDYGDQNGGENDSVSSSQGSDSDNDDDQATDHR